MATASPLVNKFNRMLELAAEMEWDETPLAAIPQMTHDYLTLYQELRDFLWEHDPDRPRPPREDVDLDFDPDEYPLT